MKFSNLPPGCTDEDIERQAGWLSYRDMADRAKPECAPELAYALLKIYEADRTRNCGVVNGEAHLCHAFSAEAQHVLIKAGVLEREE